MTYTHGHAESVLRSHRARTVENSAAYLLPHLSSSDRLLDVGSGPGTITADLARRVREVVALEISDEAAELTRAELGRQGIGHVEVRVGDVQDLDLGDAEFDVVHAHQVLQHLADPVAALREMRRVVKPGGIIVILNHFRSQRRVTGWLEDLLAPVCTRLGWKSNLMMEPLLEQVGLVPESITHVNMFKGWRLVKCINRK
jgi:ubiquinone/menaquinone biosynthesis C-methylase UbiE